MDINELELEDEAIECRDCGEEFVFTIGEQKYFLSKLLSKPKRCPQCRQKRKSTLVKDGGGGDV